MMPGKMVLYKSILGGLLYTTLTCVANAQEKNALAKFGEAIPVLGKMARTDRDFVDGLALDLLSPTSRTLVVTNNSSPLPGNFVSGSSGEGFVSLSKYSWVVKMNETANDLIAKIELPYDPAALAKQGVQAANTFVGQLSKDKKSWIVVEAQRNVHMTENKTRIIKMTSLDGEYMLLGRKSADTANIFVQYGQGATRTVNITAGADKVQEAEFIDGLRLRLQSAQSFALNADISFGVNGEALPQQTIPLNSFAWTMNSTASSKDGLSVEAIFPVNKEVLAQKTKGRKANSFVVLVARRDVKAPSTACFEPVRDQEYMLSKQAVRVKGLAALDGQYVVLVSDKQQSPRGQGEREARCVTQGRVVQGASEPTTVSSVAARGRTLGMALVALSLVAVVLPRF